MLCALAVLQLSVGVGGNFQSKWVTAGTTPRVAELLTDATMRGSALVPNAQCEVAETASTAELPCVLPINANMSLLRRGAGETTSVDVSLDVFPGPRCTFVETPKSFNRHFECSLCKPGDGPPCSGVSDIFYKYPYRGAVYHDGQVATVMRLIFPSGFDASQVEVDNNTMVLYNSSWIEKRGNHTVAVTGPYPTPLRRVRYARRYGAYEGAGVGGASPPLSYGIAEPRPAARDFSRFEGMMTSPRTGSVWGLRDEWEDGEGEFDGRRVVDLVTTDTVSSKHEYDPLAPYNRTQLSQRVALRLNGLVNRKAPGFLGSASVADKRIFAIQIYQVQLQTLTEREMSGGAAADDDEAERVFVSDVDYFKVEAKHFLMRYYNNHINDPCLAGTAPMHGGPCPETDINHNITEVVPIGPWFRETAGDEQVLLCPPGTLATDAYGVECEACPTGFISSESKARSCSACPPGTFADLTSALIPGGGAALCRGCLPGTYSGLTAASSCALCEPGSYCPGGCQVCAKCAKGSFAAGYGAEACKHCASNASTVADGMPNCQLKCLPGAAGTGGVEPCAACSPGAYTFSKVLFIVPSYSKYTRALTSGNFFSWVGTYTAALESTACVACAPGSSTDGGDIGAGGGAVACVECGAGSYAASAGSPLCRMCPAQSYQERLGATGCELCPVDERLSAAGIDLPEASVFEKSSI